MGQCFCRQGPDKENEGTSDRLESHGAVDPASVHVSEKIAESEVISAGTRSTIDSSNTESCIDTEISASTTRSALAASGAESGDTLSPGGGEGLTSSSMDKVSSRHEIMAKKRKGSSSENKSKYADSEKQAKKAETIKRKQTEMESTDEKNSPVTRREKTEKESLDENKPKSSVVKKNKKSKQEVVFYDEKKSKKTDTETKQDKESQDENQSKVPRKERGKNLKQEKISSDENKTNVPRKEQTDKQSNDGESLNERRTKTSEDSNMIITEKEKAKSKANPARFKTFMKETPESKTFVNWYVVGRQQGTGRDRTEIKLDTSPTRTDGVRPNITAVASIAADDQDMMKKRISVEETVNAKFSEDAKKTFPEDTKKAFSEDTNKTFSEDTIKTKSCEDALNIKYSEDGMKTKSSEDPTEMKSSEDAIGTKSSEDPVEMKSSEDAIGTNSSEDPVEMKSSEDAIETKYSGFAMKTNYGEDAISTKKSEDTITTKISYSGDAVETMTASSDSAGTKVSQDPPAKDDVRVSRRDTPQEPVLITWRLVDNSIETGLDRTVVYIDSFYKETGSSFPQCVPIPRDSRGSDLVQQTGSPDLLERKAPPWASTKETLEPDGPESAGLAMSTMADGEQVVTDEEKLTDDTQETTAVSQPDSSKGFLHEAPGSAQPTIFAVIDDEGGLATVESRARASDPFPLGGRSIDIPRRFSQPLPEVSSASVRRPETEMNTDKGKLVASLPEHTEGYMQGSDGTRPCSSTMDTPEPSHPGICGMVHSEGELAPVKSQAEANERFLSSPFSKTGNLYAPAALKPNDNLETAELAEPTAVADAAGGETSAVSEHSSVSSITSSGWSDDTSGGSMTSSGVEEGSSCVDVPNAVSRSKMKKKKRVAEPGATSRSQTKDKKIPKIPTSNSERMMRRRSRSLPAEDPLDVTLVDSTPESVKFVNWRLIDAGESQLAEMGTDRGEIRVAWRQDSAKQ